MTSLAFTNSTSITNRPRVGILGATLGTGNLGVDALGLAMVQGLHESLPDVEIAYQSWDPTREINIPLDTTTLDCEPLVIRRHRSLRNRNGVLQLRKATQVRKWLSKRSLSRLPSFSHTLKQLAQCDAVLDVSAGDSFADIYGKEVFWYQSQIKLLCLELGVKLVLMPQTYGPFADAECRRIAANIISRATLVCSREADGMEEVQQLCGELPPRRLVRVPDMAFLLEPRKTVLPENFQKAKANGGTCIALNISGLLYFSRRSFGLKVNYQQLAKRLVEWALAVPNSQVLLVPHVVAPTTVPKAKHPQPISPDTNDIRACEAIASALDESTSSRADILREANDPAQAKYAMSLCDFFIGARMHAFIGAISQCVPGVLLAYSKKADGLARLLDISQSIVDPRDTTLEDCLAQIDSRFRQRQTMREHLEQRIPDAKQELERFFRDEIAPIVSGEPLVETSAKSRPIPFIGSAD